MPSLLRICLPCRHWPEGSTAYTRQTRTIFASRINGVCDSSRLPLMMILTLAGSKMRQLKTTIMQTWIVFQKDTNGVPITTPLEYRGRNPHNLPLRRRLKQPRNGRAISLIYWNQKAINRLRIFLLLRRPGIAVHTTAFFSARAAPPEPSGGADFCQAAFVLQKQMAPVRSCTGRRICLPALLWMKQSRMFRILQK